MQRKRIGKRRKNRQSNSKIRRKRAKKIKKVIIRI